MWRHTMRAGTHAARTASLIFGLGLATLGAAQAAPFAYVSAYADARVAVIDTATNVVVTRITVSAAPGAVAVNPVPSLARAYAVLSAAGKVAVINTTTNSVVTEVVVGTTPLGIAVKPDGTRVYVANASSGTVSVIDTATNTVVATITIGAGGTIPVDLAVNPAGTRVYVSNRSAGTISVIDTATNSVTATISLGISTLPENIAVSPDGARLYVGRRGDNKVSVINTATNTVVTSVNVGTEPRRFAINAAGTRIYMASAGVPGDPAADFISVLNTANFTTYSVTYIDTGGDNPTGVALNPSGTRLYVSNYFSDYVSVISTASEQVVDLIDAGRRPDGIAIGPTGYTVTASPGANGSLTCVSPVIYGQTSTCTAAPGSGYRTASISGCSGAATAAGVNSYTTGAIAGNCTVSASFEALPAGDGACGSAEGVAALTAPSSNLCAAGSPSGVTSNVGNFTWTCAGTNGGSTDNCSAPRQYAVTASAGANGSLNCTSPVLAGQTSSCSATPASGYRTASVSGCGGVATGAAVNGYVTGTVNANCTVTASFEPIPVAAGTCGTASGVATLTAPNANLCSVGTPGNVVGSTNSFDWTCNGTGGGSTASCSAPRQYTVTASAGANGALACSSPVTAGQTSTCTATPAVGYRTATISGCGGTATAAGVNSYSTGVVSDDCVVSASFERLPPAPVPVMDSRGLALLALLVLGLGLAGRRAGRRRT